MPGKLVLGEGDTEGSEHIGQESTKNERRHRSECSDFDSRAREAHGVGSNHAARGDQHAVAVRPLPARCQSVPACHGTGRGTARGTAQVTARVTARLAARVGTRKAGSATPVRRWPTPYRDVVPYCGGVPWI